jgi:CorA-like Mg2+ transporter protein
MFQNSELQQSSGFSKISPGDSFEQSVNLLPSQYGTSMDPSVMKFDSLYALSELFAFAACSESQFLNMMRVLIVENISNFSEQPELSFANLTHSKAVLDEHVQHTSNTIACLRKRGGVKWPRVTATPAADIVEEALQNLLEDFEQLREHAQGLSARCVEGTDIIMNTATLQESRKAIRQAESLNGLTKLAALFIPTSFVCSFFGMNVVEFGPGRISVWVTIVVLIPVLILSGILCFGTSSDALKQFLKKRFYKKRGINTR